MINPEDVRKEITLLRENKIAYFDSATASLMPDFIIDKISEGYRHFAFPPNQGNNSLIRKSKIIIEETRESFEKFIGAEEQTIFFAPNIMYGLSNILWSLIQNKKGRIIISPLLHTSILGPIIKLSMINGNKIQIIQIDENNRLDINYITSILDKDVIAIITDDVSSIYGVQQPTKEIAQLSKEYNIPHIVDATKSIGHDHFSIKEKKVDIAIMEGNIGLMGPSVSMIHVSRENLENREPMLLGGGTIEKLSIEKLKPIRNITKYEGDFIDVAKIYGLKYAIEYIQKIGIENIRIQELKIIRKIRKILENYGLLIHSTEQSQNIISFSSETLGAHDIGMFLDEDEIYIRTGKICTYLAPIFRKISNVCQISIHYYNTITDVKRLEDGLESLFTMI